MILFIWDVEKRSFFFLQISTFYVKSGNKPYDRFISPVESLPVALAAFGEGWHNYHHVFPWDYKTSEFGDYKFNISTGFIDFFAKLGWAYDRNNKKKYRFYQSQWTWEAFSNFKNDFNLFPGKFVSPDMVARRVAKSG